MTEIYVATHKKVNYTLPTCYRMVQVNCKKTGEHWQNYLHDDYGDNISEKNGSYCELTALYQAWKNSDADIKGLCHYRRVFSEYEEPLLTRVKFTNEQGMETLCIKEPFIQKTLEKYDVILQMPCEPYPNDAKTDLLIWCYQKDIEVLERVVHDEYPDYWDCYQEIMQSKFLSYCNMMIAKREVFDEYCCWLFEILSKVEAQCDITSYDTQHKRIYGYLAEALLNVYAKRHKLKPKYLSVLYIEVQDEDKSLKNIIHTLNFKVFDTLEKWKMQQLAEFIMRFYKREMYDKYRACRRYFEKQVDHGKG